MCSVAEHWEFNVNDSAQVCKFTIRLFLTDRNRFRDIKVLRDRDYIAFANKFNHHRPVFINDATQVPIEFSNETP